MARPKKGVVPPQLRRFLFQKGHRGPKGASPQAGTSMTKRSKPSGGGGGRGHGAARIKSGFESMFEKVKPLEMLLFGGGGYYLGKALDSTGLPDLLYSRSSIFKEWVDSRYPNPVTGGTLINKTAGVATFIATLAKSAKHGLNSKLMNTALPFSLGAMLDPPNDGTSGYSTSGERW